MALSALAVGGALLLAACTTANVPAGGVTGPGSSPGSVTGVGGGTGPGGGTTGSSGSSSSGSGSGGGGSGGSGSGGSTVTATAVSSAIVAGMFVSPVTIGGMTIDPAPPGEPAAPLGLDLAEAQAYAGYTRGVVGTPIVGFSVVTVTGVSSPAGTPALTGVPAWVGVWFPDSATYSCPVEPVSSGSSTSPPPPEVKAVVFYGSDGLGADVYDSGGTGPCGSIATPGLSVADAQVPVAWQQVGPAGLTTTVSYVAPQCATLAGVGASGDATTGVYTVTVTVDFPFDRTGCATDGTFTTTVSVYPTDVGPGAPPPPTTVVLVPSTAPSAVPPALVGPVTA